MRPLLLNLPAWLTALIVAPFVLQIVWQLEIPRKWRLPAAAAAVAVIAAIAFQYRHAALPVHAYGVMLALAAVTAITVGVSRCDLAGIDRAEGVDIGLYGVLWGVVGARVFHVLEARELYFGGPEARGLLSALAVWNGGLVFYGGIVGAMCYTVYWAFWSHLGVPKGRELSAPKRASAGGRALVRLFDVAAPCVMFGLALGRVGCFLNGCCHGCVTRLACGVAYPAGSPLWRSVVQGRKDLATNAGWGEFMRARGGPVWRGFFGEGLSVSEWKEHLAPPRGVAGELGAGMMPHTFHVHPQQIYAALVTLAIGAFLSWVFYRMYRDARDSQGVVRPKTLGLVSVLFFLMYPPARFIFEGWFRGDTPRVVRALPFTISQYVSLVSFAAGIVWGAALLVASRRARAASHARDG